MLSKIKTMAIEDHTFGLIAVRVLTGCNPRFTKNLEEGRFYFFNNRYKNDGNDIIENDIPHLPNDFFGENISVHAVCGVNGSGKSSLFELVYRIVNNLSCLLECQNYRGKAEHMMYVEGLRAELYYELNNNQYSIKCYDWDIKVEGDDLDEIVLTAGGRQIDDANRIKIYNRLFYTLVTNYSMQSLVPQDFDDEHTTDWLRRTSERNWLTALYNKNDGYIAPLGFEPYKGDNKIDLETQSELVKQRAALLLLENGRFVSGYQLAQLSFELDPAFFAKKVENLEYRNHVEDADFARLDDRDTLRIMIDRFGINTERIRAKNRHLIAMAFAYIYEKIWNVAKYPTFEAYRTLEPHMPNNFVIGRRVEDDVLFTQFESLCDNIYSEKSHITTKIHQAINFLKAYLSHDNDHRGCELANTFTYQEYHEFYMNNRAFADLKEKELHFVPPFYKMTIKLRNQSNGEVVEYTGLSSGERQFVQQMSSCMYHLRNLMSVAENDADDFERPKYHFFNLFLDEIELCFHPEYQRMFLWNLIEMIKQLGINRGNHVNIIMSSHSPFLLSDMPSSHVLLLKDGRVWTDARFSNTFGANISTLLNEDFFLEKGFIGGFAQQKITGIMNVLNGEHVLNMGVDERSKIKAQIELVGDPLLRDSLMSLYYKRFSATTEERIASLRDEIRRLGGDV